MVWDRRERQEAILREKIAVIVLERLSDPRIGFVTITGVELSSDKRIAWVTYTHLGTDAQRRACQRALADSSGRVQELLAPTLRMRNMPEVRFKFDEGVEKESRLLTIIEEVTSEREAREAREAAEAAAAAEAAGLDPDALDDDAAPSTAEAGPEAEAGTEAGTEAEAGADATPDINAELAKALEARPVAASDDESARAMGDDAPLDEPADATGPDGETLRRDEPGS
jgi:ribosome-binding factor A